MVDEIQEMLAVDCSVLYLNILLRASHSVRYSWALPVRKDVLRQRNQALVPPANKKARSNGES